MCPFHIVLMGLKVSKCFALMCEPLIRQSDLIVLKVLLVFFDCRDFFGVQLLVCVDESKELVWCFTPNENIGVYRRVIEH